MKTIPKIGPMILKIIVLLIGLGFATLTSMILFKLSTEFDYIGFLVFLMMLMATLMFLNYGLSTIRQFTIRSDQGIIELVYLGLFKTIYEITSIKGYCNYRFSNRIRNYPGILIEFKNGKQVQISEFDIKNFTEVKSSIECFVSYNKNLKLILWTRFNKFLALFGIIMILFMILGKLLS